MPNKYKLTLRAERDLKDIWLYTATTWGDDQADNYITLLGQKFQTLAGSPHIGVSRPDIQTSCRFFPEGTHLIFYRLNDDDSVIILAVVHASMDIRESLITDDQDA